MEVVGQMNSFTMSNCLDCHRNIHSKIPELKNIKNGPENCWACHR
jgi:nitrate/TMAO reductase-like tetraheme cytochrome c subunit